MTQPTRRTALALIGAATMFPTVAFSQDQPVSGRYRAQGRNPDGSTYTGDVTINDAFGKITMTWRVGNQTYDGVGVREGRVLTIDWGDSHPVVYVVMPDGELHGTWADGTALERLSR